MFRDENTEEKSEKDSPWREQYWQEKRTCPQSSRISIDFVFLWQIAVVRGVLAKNIMLSFIHSGNHCWCDYWWPSGKRKSRVEAVWRSLRQLAECHSSPYKGTFSILTYTYCRKFSQYIVRCIANNGNFIRHLNWFRLSEIEAFCFWNGRSLQCIANILCGWPVLKTKIQKRTD